MPPITRPDMIGSGHNSPEAWIMWEQLGHVGNSSSGEAFQRTQKANETIYIEDTGTYIYIGYAPTGTATSASSWKIKRVDTGNPTTVLWSNGNAFYNKVWDDRGSYTYS